MVLFNYSTKELTAKIVYYGPGLCGKTTNLQFVHSNLPESVKGKMLSLATKTDRTLFFDFLPIDLGEIRGMKTRVQLYTVPGQVFYNETRKLVLKGADGIVFVADSQQQMLGANGESFKNLEDNLKAHGLKLAEMPHVIQFNKRDLPKLASIEEMNAGINKYNAPFYESVATTGIGVQDTLKAITKLVLLNLTKKYDPRAAAEVDSAIGAPQQPAARQAPQAPQAPPAAASPAPQQPPVAEPGAPRAGVPLSAAPDLPTEAPEPAQPQAPEVSFDADSDTPDFSVDDIEELVGEVDDSALATPPAAPAAAAGDSPFEIDVSGLEIEQPTDDGPSPIEPDATEQTEEPAPQPAPQPAMEPAMEPAAEVAPELPTPATPDDFQIDHQVDPGWDETPAAAAASAEPMAPAPEPGAGAPMSPTSPTSMTGGAGGNDGAMEVDPLPDVAPAVASGGNGAPAESADAAITLTEVVTDTQLFDDPSLEIARLEGAEEREIVVPVELGEGASTRRFRLSLRLRLDPIDEG